LLGGGKVMAKEIITEDELCEIQEIDAMTQEIAKILVMEGMEL
jgi:hypothetical protein